MPPTPPSAGGQTSVCPSQRQRTRAAPFALISFVAVLSFLLAPSVVAAEPRRISEAERFAVETAADFLARGPAAFQERLAAASPLQQSLRQQTLDEIEVRTGPNDDAVWELQTVVPALAEKTVTFTVVYPSGVDDTLFVDVVKENGKLRVANLRTLAEPSPYAVSSSVASSEAGGPAAHEARPRSAGIFLLGFVSIVIAGIAAMFRPSAPRATAAIVAGAIAGIIATAAWAAFADARIVSLLHREDAAEVSQQADGSLAALLPLRRAMAAGSDLPVPKGGDARLPAAMLWRAQVDLQSAREADVTRVLSAFPPDSPIPLVHLIRARSALARFEEGEAVVAYERLISVGPGRDATWYEAAGALAVLGFGDQAEKMFERLERLGSRQANVYLALSVLTEEDDDKEKQEELFRTGWSLDPSTRRDLATGYLGRIATRDSIAPLVGLYEAEEKRVVSSRRSANAIALPAEAKAVTSGEALAIEIGSRTLYVPGGAEIAPPDASSVTAEEWEEKEESEALAEMPALARASSNPNLVLQPAIRQKLIRTVAALSDRGSWEDVLRLTERISGDAENVPPELLMLRANALLSAERKVDAQRFLTAVAENPAISRTADPSVLLGLAQLMQRAKLYKPAMKLLAAAKKDRGDEAVYINERMRQLTMQSRMQRGNREIRTKNFVIRFSPELPEQQAATLGEILESELVRLRPLVPVENFQPVKVNIVTWEDFSVGVTGTEHVIGLFDGEITLPFAQVGGFPPEIVSIMTHELTHAMLAQASNGKAPRWLQEGLAQRAEMAETHRNAFAEDPDKVLPLEVVESAIEQASDFNTLGRCYIFSLTLVRHIEEVYGRRGLQALYRAYAEGSNTKEAIALAAGKSLHDFEKGFRSWGATRNKVFVNPDPIVYDRLWTYARDIDPRVLANMKFSGEGKKGRGALGEQKPLSASDWAEQAKKDNQ